MFIFKFAMALWPLAALKAHPEEFEVLHERERLEDEMWNHEEEIFQRVPNKFYESHQDRILKIGPPVDYKRMWL